MKQRNILDIAALIMASLLSGCVGIAAIDSEDYVRAIPAKLDGLGAKPDGTYRGVYTITLPAGSVAAFRHFEVDVHVASGSIAAIDLVEPEAMKTTELVLQLPKRIIASQSLDVDLVSGATYSSKSFVKAVENAIRN